MRPDLRAELWRWAARLCEVRTLGEFRHRLRSYPPDVVAAVEAKLSAEVSAPWWDRLADSCERVTELERTGEIAFVHDLDSVRGYPSLPARPSRAQRRSDRSVAWASGQVVRHSDPLKRILACTYYEVLTGQPVSQGGWALCVLHDDHRPSLRCRGTSWRCFACNAGGTIVDLGAHLWKLEPRGRGYLELRRRLAEALLAGKAAGQ